jgi:hypothetical protein
VRSESRLKEKANAEAEARFGVELRQTKRELAIAQKIQKDIATEGENNLKKQAMEARKTEKDVTARHKRQLEEMRGDLERRKEEASKELDELYRQGRQKTREVVRTCENPPDLVRTSFFVPYSHWNWCFHRSRRVFRAVIVSAGSPPTQLHTCTTTFLTLLSFSFCVQSSGRNYSTHSIWVASAKAQKKVHNKFFLTFHYCPPLAPFHTHCLTHLPLVFLYINPCFFLVCI